MSEKHILVANEPLAYREVIASALRLLRPGLAVRICEPDLLREEVTGLDPVLVVASCPRDVGVEADCVWVALYPDGNSYSIVSSGGEDVLHGSPDLDHILTLVDSLSA